MANPACPYCEKPSELVTGREVYATLPHLHDKKIYRCLPCGAWVGCHPGTDVPLGRLANAQLRRARVKAHDAFDPLWRKKRAWDEPPFRSRSEAYAWLGSRLGLKKADCHIGMFDLDTCKRVIEVCIDRRKAAA